MNGNTGEYTFSHYLGNRAIMFRSGFEISIQRHRDLQDNRPAALVCILYTKCHRVSPGVQALVTLSAPQIQKTTQYRRTGSVRISHKRPSILLISFTTRSPP